MRICVENGTFRWNTVESKETDAESAADPSAPDTASTADTFVSRVDSTNGTNNYFELRDITVRFPEGKLTIVTGPTASGKTALLVGCWPGFETCITLIHSVTAGGSWRDDPGQWSPPSREEPSAGRRARHGALNLVRCSNTVVAPPVHQEQYSVRVFV